MTLRDSLVAASLGPGTGWGSSVALRVCFRERKGQGHKNRKVERRADAQGGCFSPAAFGPLVELVNASGPGRSGQDQRLTLVWAT